MIFEGKILSDPAPEEINDKILEKTDLFSCGALIYNLCGFSDNSF